MCSWLSIRLLNLEISQNSQTQAIDDAALDRSNSFVHSVSAKWRTYDDTFRALAGSDVHYRIDRVCDVLRIRSICALEQANEGLHNLPRNLRDLPISGSTSCICRLLRRRVHIRRMCTGLDQDNINTQLRQFVAIAVRQCLNCHLRGAVKTEERQGHSTQDRAHIDYKAGMLRSGGGEGGAQDPLDAEN